MLILFILSTMTFAETGDSTFVKSKTFSSKENFKYEFVNLKLKSATTYKTPNKNIKIAAIVGYPIIITVMSIGYASGSDKSQELNKGAFIGSALILTALTIYIVATN